MARKQGVGALERLVLMAVLRLGDEAYGQSIREELHERAGRRIGPGTIYPTLDRLESKGLLTSRLGEPTPERGGRAKRYFTPTEAGIEELRRGWREITRLARGFEGILDPDATS